jgi:general secretion pathway protein F
MPLYQYQAATEKGKVYKATIDADSLQDAKLKLVRKKISAFEVIPVSKKQAKESLNRTELLNLTREIARLLQSGLPLFESLAALEEKYQGQKAGRIILDLCDQVKSGASFSYALQRHSNTFDLLYTSMVANAEKTGSLAIALKELAELLSRQQKVKKQLVSALLYPAMLSSFCLVVLSSLLFYVIPSLRELFDGRDLHPFTQIVFTISDYACRMKEVLAILFAGCLLLGGAVFFSSKWKSYLFSFILRAPFFRNLFAKVAFVRFSRALSSLLEGGVSLVQAFSQARSVMQHPILESVIENVEKQVSQGNSIAGSFRQHSLIAPLIPRMIGIAEEGGNLPFMMKQIADIYEEELEKTLYTFANIAQPVLLLILGVIIGFVLLSVLLPLTDVSSFATN